MEQVRQQVEYIEWLLDEEDAENLPHQLREAAYKMLEIIAKHEESTPPPPRKTPYAPDGEPIRPRSCTKCGAGMSDGYMAEDGSGTWCSDKCLFTDGYTPEQYQEDYDAGSVFYTAWEDEETLLDGEGWTKDGTCYLFDEATNTWKQEVKNG